MTEGGGGAGAEGEGEGGRLWGAMRVYMGEAVDDRGEDEGAWCIESVEGGGPVVWGGEGGVVADGGGGWAVADDGRAQGGRSGELGMGGEGGGRGQGGGVGGGARGEAGVRACRALARHRGVGQERFGYFRAFQK
ncbi:hypothetical protein B1218_35415 [Pseudomonas ogarae]|nr:hypothetical protein B1218_35415 [Pseudomonas ogarae]